MHPVAHPDTAQLRHRFLLCAFRRPGLRQAEHRHPGRGDFAEGLLVARQHGRLLRAAHCGPGRGPEALQGAAGSGGSAERGGMCTQEQKDRSRGHGGCSKEMRWRHAGELGDPRTGRRRRPPCLEGAGQEVGAKSVGASSCGWFDMHGAAGSHPGLRPGARREDSRLGDVQGGCRDGPARLRGGQNRRREGRRGGREGRRRGAGDGDGRPRAGAGRRQGRLRVCTVGRGSGGSGRGPGHGKG
mmetsp:Transcript_124658/g.399366  ORF Transcript_124658/g.399366 Transcript_124658/m.399366 type:complete len:242 (-) Transcript_124658:276-1001(-)